MKVGYNSKCRLMAYQNRANSGRYTSNDWRKLRFENIWEPAWHGELKDGKIFADNLNCLGDYIGEWNDLIKSYGRSCYDATGFYIDDHYNDTMKGGVEKIRSAKGTYYVPVTYCTGWDGVTYYWEDAEIVPRGATESDHETAIHEAARAAYNRADSEAEECREDNAKQLAESDISEARSRIHGINQAVLPLLKEIKGKQFGVSVCQALRDRVEIYLQERRVQFGIISRRQADYWSAVSSV